MTGAHFSPSGKASLGGLPDEDLLALCREFPDGSSERAAARDVLVRRYEPAVRGLVRQYRASPEPAEDLMQVGYVGLLKAINNFDPAFGRGLQAYALPCISGEIKKHFRDKRWQVRVSRPVQELLLDMRGAAEKLTHELGRHPSDAELAGRLGVTAEEVREARQAGEAAFAALSLDAPVGGPEDTAELGSLLGEEDAAIGRAMDMDAVARHWDELPQREQRILVMRFYGNMTQEQIAGRLGISQMHVSRLQARALGQLKSRLLDDPALRGRAARRVA
jgi:RNA polymerase sigma-B factor